MILAEVLKTEKLFGIKEDITTFDVCMLQMCSLGVFDVTVESQYVVI